MKKLLFWSPSRISIAGFMVLIAAGTLLLKLPAASGQGGLGWIDALFTATSASCVTGLVVVDTGTGFTHFGQGVILMLIQVGGLGIMTISTLLLLVVRRRPGMTRQIVIQDTFTHSGEWGISSILREVVLFTLVIEAAGAALLFWRFLPGRSPGQALYLSVFHAVSAFCNAGFSLFSDSFVGFREDWVLNLTVCFLIISGGMGFLVLTELKHHPPLNRRTFSRLSLHTRLVLFTTGILLLLGMLMILFAEWNNTLRSFSFPGRFLGAFFQSVTARTAGFNTLPIDGLSNETLFGLILLMFIGASPGSCGGGIKTSTFAGLVLLGYSRLRGQTRPQVFFRSIPEASIAKAISVIMIAMVVVILGTMLLQMTEVGEVPHAASRGRFLELFFETVSAFGTVGLSTGATAGLSRAGKVVVTLLMFVGRLGPLVVAVAISRTVVARYYYAEENIMIG